MKGLSIIIAGPDQARFRAALTLALAQAALGGTARLYCHEYSVLRLVARSLDDDESVACSAAGLPDRLQLLTMAREAGIALTACQTGLALCGLTMDDLVEGAESGGMIGVLAKTGDDRWVTF